MTALSLTNLTVLRGECPVVDNATFTIKAGECVGLIGPNGAGKTTLMRAALGLLPHQGSSSLAELPAKTRAKAAAWMPQQREIAWPLPVETLVALGRTPHVPRGGRLASADRLAVDTALSAMDLTHMRDRPATQLSGGEQARALIARVLAQNTPLIMADEPVAGLDPAAQLSTLTVLRDQTETGERAVFLSLHDLGLAARFCTRLILMHQGRILADGAPQHVLSARNIADAFHLNARFVETDHGPIFQPLDVLR